MSYCDCDLCNAQRGGFACNPCGQVYLSRQRAAVCCVPDVKTKEGQMNSSQLAAISDTLSELNAVLTRHGMQIELSGDVGRFVIKYTDGNYLRLCIGDNGLLEVEVY